MALAKTGQIANCCLPNALLPSREYINDYGDDELRQLGSEMIDKEIQTVPNQGKERAVDYLGRIRTGERDLGFNATCFVYPCFIQSSLGPFSSAG